MDLRCQYASTHCPNMRSLKISGELHRFCLFHRRSANAAQRRWKQKKAAATNAVNASTSEDDAIAKPTKSVTRRRPRTEAATTAVMNEPMASKRCRTNREIAAPRALQAIQRATPTQRMLMPSSGTPTALSAQSMLESLPPLFTSDDVNLLSRLVLGGDDTTLPLYVPGDSGWMDASYHQDVGVIV